MECKEYVNRLRTIFKKADVPLQVNKPLLRDTLSVVEKDLGLKIDKDLAALWEYANGASDHTTFFARNGFLTGYDFISLEKSMDLRKRMESRSHKYSGYTEPAPRDERIKKGWFEKGWIPFGNFGGGELILISDLSPSEKGTVGQIIGFVHDPDEIVFIAESFRNFLKLSIDAFEENYEEYLGLY